MPMEPWDAAITSLVPSFHVGQLNEVVCIVVQRRFDNIESRSVVDCMLRINFSAPNDGDVTVSLRLGGVQRLRLPEISTRVFHFVEPFILDVSDRGMERIRYDFADESTAFRCECAEIEVLGVVARER